MQKEAISFTSFYKHGRSQFRDGTTHSTVIRYHTGVKRNETEENAAPDRILLGLGRAFLYSSGNHVHRIRHMRYSSGWDRYHLLCTAATYLWYTGYIEVS